MVDMRTVWKAQLNLCKAIAVDIIKHKASKEICRYTDGFAMIESPYGTRGGDCGNDFIRVNFGEAYCYIDIDEDNAATGYVWWNNDEMGVEHTGSYQETFDDLSKMSLEEAYNSGEYPPYCYDEYEGAEDEYAKGLTYIPYNEKQTLS